MEEQPNGRVPMLDVESWIETREIPVNEEAATTTTSPTKPEPPVCGQGAGRRVGKGCLQQHQERQQHKTTKNPRHIETIDEIWIQEKEILKGVKYRDKDIETEK